MMKYIFSLILSLLCITTNAQLTAFPGAKGGGAYATGGRGGPVYHVTNLNNSGSGSFRTALSNAAANNGNVVFDVSGTINLTSWLTVSGSNFTVFGQSAPVGGITITSTTLQRFRGQDINNVIIRYIRVRPNRTPDDAFEFYGNSQGAYNLMLDHWSVSYGGDECFSLRGIQTHSTTMQRCMIVDGKTGSLWGDSSTPANSYNNSVIENLYANISHRTPNMATTGRGDIINNVVQNHQYRLTFTNGAPKLNHINNYIAMGASNSLKPGSQGQGNQANSNSNNEIYSAGNIIDKGILTDPEASNWFTWYEFQAGTSTVVLPTTEFVNEPYEIIGPAFTPMTAVEAYSSVLADVGANASMNADGTVTRFSDAIDTHHLNAMAGGEGHYWPYQMSGNDVRTWFDEAVYSNFLGSISSTPINTRPGNYDTDGDGVPNVFEIAQGWDPDVADSHIIEASGYSRLETFMNQVDGDQEPPEEIAVTALTWNNDTQTVGMGGFLDLSITWTPSNATDKGFSIFSSNTDVVSHAGAVIGEGTATLTITADDDTNGTISDVMNVTVNAEPEPSGPSGKINKGQFFIIDN